MPDPQYYTVPIQGLPYKMPWTGATPPTTADLNGFAAYIAAQPAHQLAAYQSHTPQLPAGIDPGAVAAYRQQWFGADTSPDTTPARTLGGLLGLDPQARGQAVSASGFSPVGQAALLQEAWSQNPGPYRLPKAQQISKLSGDLGVTPQQARAQGVAPAVAGNKAQRAALMAQRQSLQTTVAPAGQAPGTPGIDLSGMFGPQISAQQRQQQLASIDAQLAALGTPQAQPGIVQPQTVAPQLPPITSPLLADVAGQFATGELGHSEPGTLEQLAGMNDWRAGLGTGLLGFTEPQNLELMAALGPAGGNVGKIALGGFGAMAAKNAYEEAQAGRPQAALGSLLAFGLPLGLHGGLGRTKGAPAITPDYRTPEVNQEAVPQGQLPPGRIPPGLPPGFDIPPPGPLRATVEPDHSTPPYVPTQAIGRAPNALESGPPPPKALPPGREPLLTPPPKGGREPIPPEPQFVEPREPAPYPGTRPSAETIPQQAPVTQGTKPASTPAEVAKNPDHYLYHVSEARQDAGLRAQPFGVEAGPVVWLSRAPVVRNGHVYAIDPDLVPGNIRNSRNGFPVHEGDIPREAITYLGERSAHEPFQIAGAQPPPGISPNPGPRIPNPEEVAPVSQFERAAPESIGVRPGMQYKKVGITDTANAVSDTLKGTDVYDVDQGGPLTVFRDADGSQWVVNGHHRLELAKRAGRFVRIGPDGQPADVPREVPTRVLDARVGWTPEGARAYGALENIRDGKGSPLDALEVVEGLHIAPADFPGYGISTTSEMSRSIAGLGNLNPEAITRVRMGDIAEPAAAGIGSVEGLTAGAQNAAMQEAVQHGYATYNKARSLAAEYRADELAGTLVHSGQESLFGDEMAPQVESTRAIRVEIRAGTERALLEQRRDLLKPIDATLRTGEAIDAEGRRSDALRMAESGRALQARADLLFQQESVRERLADLATEVGRGSIGRPEAVRRLTNELAPHIGRSVADLFDPARIRLSPQGAAAGPEHGASDALGTAPRGYPGESLFGERGIPEPEPEPGPDPADELRTGPESAPALPGKLKALQANTLGKQMAPGDALGERLRAATSGLVRVTPEEAARLRDLIAAHRMDPRFFPGLYSEHDLALLKKGPQKLGSGVNLMDVARSAPGVFKGDKPVLTGLSRTASNRVSQAESSHQTSRLEANRAIPQVLAHLSPADRAKFQIYGNADQMLSLRDEVTSEMAAQKAEYSAKMGDAHDLDLERDRLRRRSPIDWQRNHEIGQEIAKLGDERTALAAKIRANQDLLDNIALGRKTDPLAVEIAPGKTQIVSEKGVQAFFARPEIKAAVATHKAEVQTLLDANQRAQGGPTGLKAGKYSGAYFPSSFEFDETHPGGANPSGGAGSGGRKAPLAQLAGNENARRFTGGAKEYKGDYAEVTRTALEAGYRRAAEREMHQTLLDEGIAQRVDGANTNLRHVDGKLEIHVKGEWAPGVEVTLQKGMRLKGGGVGGVTDPSLPTTIALPADVYNEIKPMFDRAYQGQVDQVLAKWHEQFYKLFLAKPADLAQHGLALGGRAAHGAVQAPMPLPAGLGKKAATLFQSTANFFRFGFLSAVGKDIYDPAQTYKALHFASKVGVLPYEFGTQSGSKVLGSQTLGKFSDWQHNTLYGDHGILAKAITSVYNEFERQGALATPEGQDMLRAALRDSFNTHGRTDQAVLERGLRSIGAGSFYKTGVKNRTASLASGNRNAWMMYGAGLAGRALFIVAAVKAFDKDHRLPWEIPGYKWGDIPVGKDSDGRQLYFSGSAADRVGFYPDFAVRSLLSSFNSKRTPAGTGWSLFGDTINYGLGPAVSGPAAGIGSAVTGKVPYWFPNKDNSGLEIADAPHTPFFSLARARAVGRSVLPAAGLAFGDSAEDAKSAPKSLTAHWANRGLALVGMTPVRAGQREGDVLKQARGHAAAERKLGTKH